MDDQPLVIAIDGPAGAGKSTVSRSVAERLGLLYLDTGAMYRAATVGLLDDGIDLEDPVAVALNVRTRVIDFDEQGAVRLDGRTLGNRIRTPATTAEVWRVANNPECREHLVDAQRAIVNGRDAVVEGRDATTVICPHAPLKVYLDASPEERARRRVQEWQGEDDTPTYNQVVEQIRERDERDSSRAVGALTLADDAFHLVTDGLAPTTVITTIIAQAIRRRPLFLEPLLHEQVLIGRSRRAGYVRVAQGSVNDPPAPWQLGLTNPSPGRMPGDTTSLSRNHGGRQAGVLLQGKAILVFAGAGEEPGNLLAIPMLPQSWYVIEPGCWHAVIQDVNTICAWAEASGLSEDRCDLTPARLDELAGFVGVFLPSK